MNTSILRPGLLVSLKTSVRGGVTYEKVMLDAEHVPDENEAARRARWETTRTIRDAAEHKRAATVRSKAGSLIWSTCCPSAFGLLCPMANEDKLREAIEAAQKLADEHNKTALHTRVEVYVITGRVADNDEQAARAISSEVRSMMDAMEAGVRAASPTAIREAANKARALSGMLSADVQGKVTAAIAEVRAIARDIVQRVGKDGEQAAKVVEGLKLEKLNDARFSALDFDGGEQAGAALTTAVAARSLELDAEPKATGNAGAYADACRILGDELGG
jgi:hypothetical protein